MPGAMFVQKLRCLLVPPLLCLQLELHNPLCCILNAEERFAEFVVQEEDLYCFQIINQGCKMASQVRADQAMAVKLMYLPVVHYHWMA